MGSPLRTFLAFRSDEAWDSAWSGLRVVVGAFLVVGLLGPLRHGARQLQFRVVEGDTPVLHEHDLRAGGALPRGRVAVTGYPLGQHTEGYVDAQGPGLAWSESYFILLGSAPPGTPSSRFAVVERSASASPAQPTPPVAPDPHQPLTIEGVAGYGAGEAPSSLEAELRGLAPAGVEPLRLVEGAVPPPVGLVLAWWLPALLAFGHGAAQLAHWLVRVRRQAL